MSAGTKVLAVLCIILGFGIGTVTSHDEVKTETRILPGKVRTVTETKTVTKVTPLPASCDAAIQQAGALVTVAGKVSTTSSVALDFLTNVRTVIISRNPQGANDLENRVRAFDSGQIKTTQKLSDDVTAFNTSYSQCQDDLG